MTLLLIGSPVWFQFSPCPVPRAVQVKPVRLIFCLLSVFSPGKGFPVSLTGVYPRSRYRVILTLVFLFHAFSLSPYVVFNVRPEARARARKPVPGLTGIIAGASPCFDSAIVAKGASPCILTNCTKIYFCFCANCTKTDSFLLYVKTEARNGARKPGSTKKMLKVTVTHKIIMLYFPGGKTSFFDKISKIDCIYTQKTGFYAIIVNKKIACKPLRCLCLLKNPCLFCA